MYSIIEKKRLSENVVKMVIDAPLIARKCEPGQFTILRVNEEGERIPLTIADYDRKKGTVTIIFQEVGKTTKLLGTMNAGDNLRDFVGPLGTASELEEYKRAVVIGGGLGCAIAYPQAKKLHDLGAHVDSIVGFRTKDLIILEDEMRAASDHLYICTDDGSYGEKGFVTDALDKLLAAGNQYDVAIVIGPLVMMKFVSKVTAKYGLKTIVSMNPIMIDGTGMCGGCRVKVGNEIKFACVDGPDFDGHQIDFDDAISRSKMYVAQERSEMDHFCNLMNKEVK
jgi:ferredoxin--NADP+ reductase